MAPLLTQLLTWVGSVGPGAMSGSWVPAAMPLAIWLVESRLVVMWTLMCWLASNGARTSLNALSSAPPQAVQTVTSVDDAPWLLLLFPPEEQAAARSSVPRLSAIALELSLLKTSAIAVRSSQKLVPAGGPEQPRCRGASAHLATRQRERSPWLTSG